jgi:outer membrane protein assembly factor BamD
MSRNTAGRLLLLALATTMIIAACGKRPPKDKYAGQSAQEIYEVGVRYLDRHKWKKARSAFQNALGRVTTTPVIIAQVHLGLADAYFHDGGVINLAEALSRYTNFLTFYPNHERADYAQYQLALCYLKQALSPDRDQTQTRKAVEEFLRVSTDFPNSEYVGQANEMVNRARERLAESDFRIGRQYFRTGAYEGATLRFGRILEEYPLYSRIDRLYLLLGQSLIKLDREEEGRIYLQ